MHTIKEIADMLYGELEAMRRGEVPVQRVTAASGVVNQMIKLARLQLDYYRIVGDSSRKKDALEALLSGDLPERKNDQ